MTFFLRRARTNKTGLAPILARITTNGVSKEVYIQCSVPADRWNQSKEWATGRGKLCQQVNAYLKELAGICNIDKTLTTHCARHAFACLAVEYGMPIDVLAKILEHSNTNMTRHYAKFSEQLIGREMQKIGEILTA
ncbi:tyrosine-type recombinase/integrase [Alistipes sp. kh20]|nr:tyrosine-type recombinase/integrase [Alistipes montrealensis]